MYADWTRSSRWAGSWRALREQSFRQFKKLARYLEGKTLAKRIEEDQGWFGK